MAEQTIYDLAIIGGGVNGCGIARDASGRGLSVFVCEKGDLAQGTSSASTKLFHGGLRYLEFYEFRLVREALIEREVLLRAMPHISWPLRFVLPHHAGLRPAWLVRLGLFIYDHLGGRRILPGTRTVALREDPAGAPLRESFEKGFEYSDCWVEDSRLVVLNARDAAARGATVAVRARCVSAERRDRLWRVTIEDAATGARREIAAKALVNAGGPWVDEVLRERLRLNTRDRIRLVRGSHIVTRKLFDHDRAYIFQNADGRVVFAIPYETDFTLIGTTDRDHEGSADGAACAPEEAEYLRAAASAYLRKPIAAEDVVWTYAGVRPLYDDGAKSATQATRDYVLRVEGGGEAAPILNVFGGKITTYRRLAEAALEKLRPFFPEMKPAWTAGVPLPGGDFPVDGAPALVASLRERHPFLDAAWALRLVRAYGVEAAEVLGGAETAEALGRRFGWNLTEAEVRWLMTREWARTAEDVLWRRSKLGLRLTPEEAAALDAWMRGEAASAAA
ncbi:MAG: glycerol-3-phosphate dehydrogenase [Rhodobacteraceae bacterium]|nr:MAG: glycerol-3-phosphate dehydrogenase [Paracoccaceae bacterium]